jgi:hypothetical protein
VRRGRAERERTSWHRKEREESFFLPDDAGRIERRKESSNHVESGWWRAHLWARVTVH